MLCARTCSCAVREYSQRESEDARAAVVVGRVGLVARAETPVVSRGLACRHLVQLIVLSQNK